MGPALHISGPSGIYRDKLAGMFLFDILSLGILPPHLEHLKSSTVAILHPSSSFNFPGPSQSCFLIPGKQMLF